METVDRAKFHIVQAQGWIRRGDKFLMAQRSFKELQAPGAWSIPGGKVEAEVGSHVLEQTLKKEILEEVGVGVADEMEFIFNDGFVRVDGTHVISCTFLCNWVSGEARALEETEKVEWFTIEELKNFPDAPDFLKRLVNALVKYLEKNNL